MRRHGHHIRDQKKLDTLKKKLHTDDECTSVCLSVYLGSPNTQCLLVSLLSDHLVNQTTMAAPGYARLRVSFSDHLKGGQLHCTLYSVNGVYAERANLSEHRFLLSTSV